MPAYCSLRRALRASYAVKAPEVTRRPYPSGLAATSEGIAKARMLSFLLGVGVALVSATSYSVGVLLQSLEAREAPSRRLSRSPWNFGVAIR